MPHLKYLTSLSLTNINESASGSRATSFDDINPDSKEICQWGSSLQEIWSAVIKADICLEEITVDVVVPAFIDYLASYSGLKLLTLTGGGDSREYSDHLATRFYSEALGNHVRSLRKLAVRAVWEGLWCVGEHNLSLISQCPKLKHLEVSIISSDVDFNSVDRSSTGIDVITRILDMIAASIPQLDTLDIRPATPERLRTVTCCQNPIVNHFTFTRDEMVARIAIYQAPPSCERLPSLSVGKKQFLECQNSDGRWTYVMH